VCVYAVRVCVKINRSRIRSWYGVLIPSIVIVSLYFEDRRALAIGIAMSGFGVGAFAFALLTNALLSQYSWKGTVLIEAGILLNCILCGIVFRPPNMYSKLDPVQRQQVVEERSTDVVGGAEEQRNEGASVQQTTEVDGEISEEPATSSSHNSSTPQTNLTRRNNNLVHSDQCPDDRNQCFQTTMSLEETSEQPSAKTWITKTKKIISEIIDFRLFLDVVFDLFAISNMLTWFANVVMYVFLPNRGLHLGFDSYQSSWLISVLGISNTVGRVIFGLIADMKCVNHLVLYNTALVICGLFAILSVPLWTFPFQIFASSIYGFFFGTQ